MSQHVRDQEIPSQTGDLPEPDSPLDLEPADWKATLKRTLSEIKADRVTLTAGGLAYYWFLSLFPLLIAAVGLVTVMRLPASTLDAITGPDGLLRDLLPGDAARILTSAVTSARERPSGGLIAVVVGLAISLWSASSGVGGMLSGLNIAYDVAEDYKFLKKRLISLVLLAATLVLGGIAAALLVFGAPLGQWLQDAVPIAGTVFEYVWTAARLLGTLLVITTLFAVFYFLGPNRPSPSWEWISAGGVVATLIWILASLGFSFYVTRFGAYGETYGALAGVVVLILWLYLTALAILVGAELNAEVERQAERKRAAQGRLRSA